MLAKIRRPSSPIRIATMNATSQPEGVIGAQLPDVFPVLNAGDRDGEGADADQQQPHVARRVGPQNRDGALLRAAPAGTCRS